MLRKTFISRDSQLWKNSYTSLVRPHLEYAVPVWNPYLEGDISTIENVQERAARIPTSLRGLKDYEARLDSWGLTKLEDRRIRGDLIQMYKNLKNLENEFLSLIFSHCCAAFGVSAHCVGDLAASSIATVLVAVKHTQSSTS